MDTDQQIVGLVKIMTFLLIVIYVELAFRKNAAISDGRTM